MYVSLTFEPTSVFTRPTGFVHTPYGNRVDCWPIGDGAIPNPGDVCKVLFGQAFPPEMVESARWAKAGLSLEEQPAANWAEEWEPERYEKVFVATALLQYFERGTGYNSFLFEWGFLLETTGISALSWSFKAAFARLNDGPNVAIGVPGTSQQVVLEHDIRFARIRGANDRISPENLWQRMLWGRLALATDGAERPQVSADLTLPDRKIRPTGLSTLVGMGTEAPNVYVFPANWPVANTTGLADGAAFKLPESMRESLEEAADALRAIPEGLSWGFAGVGFLMGGLPLAFVGAVLAGEVEKKLISAVADHLDDAAAENQRLNRVGSELLEAVAAAREFFADDGEPEMDAFFGLTPGQMDIIADCLKKGSIGTRVGDIAAGHELLPCIFLADCLTEFEYEGFRTIHHDAEYLVGVGWGNVDAIEQWRPLGHVSEAARMIELASHVLKGLLMVDDAGMGVAGVALSGGMLSGLMKESIDGALPSGCVGEFFTLAAPAELFRVLWRVNATERFITKLHTRLGTDDGCLYPALCSWYDGTTDSLGVQLSVLARGDLVLGPRDYTRDSFKTPRVCTSSNGELGGALTVNLFPGRRFEEGILYRVLFQAALIAEQKALELASRNPGLGMCNSDYWADLPPDCIPGVDVTCRDMEILKDWFRDQKKSCLC